MKLLNDDLLKYLKDSLLNKKKAVIMIFIIIIFITIFVKALTYILNWNIRIYDIFTMILSITSIILTIILFDKLILNKKKLLNIIESEDEKDELIISLSFIRKILLSQSSSSNNDFHKSIKTLYKVKENIDSNEYCFLAVHPYKEYIEKLLSFIDMNNHNLVNLRKTPDKNSYILSGYCDKIINYVESKKEKI